MVIIKEHPLAVLRLQASTLFFDAVDGMTLMAIAVCRAILE